MKAVHLEFLVEEPSMEAYLQGILPKILGQSASFNIYPYQGKADLLGKLANRLRGYRSWLPPDWRVFVVVDRDDQDCNVLKQQMEAAIVLSGLRTRSSGNDWQVVSRIAIEELEAWYFGDWAAVHSAFPKVPTTVPSQAKYRSPDQVTGGTWEAFQRVLQRAGYYPGGLRKVEAARLVSSASEPDRNRSASFRTLHAAINEALAPAELGT